MDQYHRSLIEYFIDHTNQRYLELKESTNEQHRKLEQKVDRIISFKFVLIGAAMGISGTVSLLFQVAIAMMHK